MYIHAESNCNHLCIKKFHAAQQINAIDSAYNMSFYWVSMAKYTVLLAIQSVAEMFEEHPPDN